MNTPVWAKIFTMAEGLQANAVKATSQVNSCEVQNVVSNIPSPSFADLQSCPNVCRWHPNFGEATSSWWKNVATMFLRVIFAFFIPNYATCWGKKLCQGSYILNKMSQGLRPCRQMWILISPMPHASHSPSGWRGNELLEQDCLLGCCLAGLASGLMVCLLAESTRYLTQRYLDIFIHSMHCVSKRTLNWPGICQWDPPSQAFYPSIRTCINCWNLSNEHLQVRQKKQLVTDWNINIFSVLLPQKISKDRFLFHSQKVERKLDRISHLAHSISKSRQRELARLLRHNHGEILHFIWKGPWKMMELFTTDNTTPQFLLPLRQHLSLPMRTHLAPTVFNHF